MATKFLRHSDELYHYGVKGMKWHDHVYAYENLKRVGKDIIDANFKPIKGKDVITSRGLARKKARKAPTAESLEKHVDPSVRRGEMRLRDSQRRSKALEKGQYESKAQAEQQKIRLRDDAVRDAVRKESLRRAKEEEHIREKERKASQVRNETIKRDKQIRNEDIARKNYEANRREINERHERVAKNVSDQRRRNYDGREAALREQERQSAARKTRASRDASIGQAQNRGESLRDARLRQLAESNKRRAEASIQRYAAANARGNARLQRTMEKHGRDDALREQERQSTRRRRRGY